MTAVRFEYPLGVQSNSERRYVVLEVVDISSTANEALQQIIKNAKELTGVGQEKEKPENTDEDLDIKDSTANEGVKNARQIDNMVKTMGNQKLPVPDVRDSYSNNRSSKKHSGNTLFAIALPYPSTFSETTTQNWSSSKGIMGTLGGMVEDFSMPGIGMNASKFVGAAANSAGIRKPIVNPGYFQDYEGPTPRTFSFEWSLMPNSAKEANEIALIVYNLKKFTSPQKQMNDTVLLQPFSVNITMMNNVIDPVQGMDLLVCNSVSIDWGSKSQLFPDGTPKQVTLRMEFQERRTLTSDDY